MNAGPCNHMTKPRVLVNVKKLEMYNHHNIKRFFL